MFFTIFFVNHTTGEVICQQVYSVRAAQAVTNFRRKHRSYGTISKGDSYSIVLYEGLRDISIIPDEVWEAPAVKAR